MITCPDLPHRDLAGCDGLEASIHAGPPRSRPRRSSRPDAGLERETERGVPETSTAGGNLPRAVHGALSPAASPSHHSGCPRRPESPPRRGSALTAALPSRLPAISPAYRRCGRPTRAGSPFTSASGPTRGRPGAPTAVMARPRLSPRGRAGASRVVWRYPSQTMEALRPPSVVWPALGQQRC